MDAERPGMNYSICSTHLNLTMVSFHIDTVIKLLGYFVVVFGFFLCSCQSKSTVDVMGKWTCK